MGSERAAPVRPRTRARRRRHTELGIGAAPAPDTRTWSGGLLELQGVAGNAAVMHLLQGMGALGVSRAVDAPAPPVRSAALDEAGFNPDTIAHDLLRAINQKEHSVVIVHTGRYDSHEDIASERRSVNVEKVIEVLESLTASQVAEVEKRYQAFEGRPLSTDLFEGGESNRQSSLTPDQRARIGVLLKGTRAEPLPPQVLADLKKYPPELAAEFGRALLEKGNAEAAKQQLEAASIEVHELLTQKSDDEQRERLMALFRRPAKDVAAMEASFTQKFGVATLDILLVLWLHGLQRSRMAALRRGDIPLADALAIEDKRRAIESLNEQEKADSGALADLTSTTVFGGMVRVERAAKKAELTGGIEAIVAMNRREALADRANTGKSSGEAVVARLNKVFGQRPDPTGATLGAELNKTLGKEHADIVNAASDLWNTSGSSALVEAAAAELVAMEADHTTDAVKIIATLRSFRKLAEHDLQAHVLEPSVTNEEREAIGHDSDGAATRLTQRYIQEYRAAYDRRRGGGRTYDKIVSTADEADRGLIGNLSVGGGQTSDVAELQHAMDKKDIATVKKILRNQRGREAIEDLIATYNRMGDGRDFKKELFGHTQYDQQASTAEQAEAGESFSHVPGMVKGRDATQIEEQLQKPAADEMAGKSTRGRFKIPIVPGQAEADWIAQFGAREYDVTMEHRGAMGHMREWSGGDPETERLLKASNTQLDDLRKQLQASKDPDERRHLLLEMRKTRAALSGDADAYEKENERLLGEIRGALSFAVSIALAVAIPGAGATLAAFIETTALNIAANVAANIVIKGGDYGWDDLKGDVLGGVMGAGGAKFGEELLGRVAAKIVPSTARAAAGAAEKVGLQTGLKEAAAAATTGEKVAIGAEEFEAKQAGREAASALEHEGEAAAAGAAKEPAAAAEAGGAPATTAKQPPTPSWLEQGAREVGGFFGGIFGGQLPSGDFHLSVEELLQNLAATAAGKGAHKYRETVAANKQRAAAGEHPTAQQEGPGGEKLTVDEPSQSEHQPEEEPTRRESEPSDVALPVGGAAREAAPANADVFGPRAPGEMLAANGIPSDSARGFQQFADQRNLVIKVRPTNTASVGVLKKGGLPKAEIVKAKTLKRIDRLIGGPAGQEGKVGFFEPTLPSKEILGVLTPEALQQVTERYNERREEFDHYSTEYAELTEQGLVRIENGVLQIADPRKAATPDAPHGPFKDVGGDHDVYDIRHADGSPLTDHEREAATKELRSLGINVEHGFHTAWEQDSPETYSPEADAKIRELHAEREPLVAFVPLSTPREVFADTEVLGPERTVSNQDPHHPLKGAAVVGPHDVPPEGAPGTGGAGEVQIPGETDFGRVMPDASHAAPDSATPGSNEPTSGPKEPTPGSKEPTGGSSKAARAEAGPDTLGSASVRDVLPEMRNSRSQLDRQTAAAIDSGVVHVEILEELPRRPPAEVIKNGGNPLKEMQLWHPRLGWIRLELDAIGHSIGHNEILVNRNMSPSKVMETLRHEVNHALREPSIVGTFEDYQAEFDAYWMDGSHDQFKPKRRAKEIREAILEGYPKLRESYDNTPGFAEQVDKYRRPKGNTLNSVAWFRVQTELLAGAHGFELRALNIIRDAPAAERKRLAADPNFEALLAQHLSDRYMAAARRMLAID